jgi:hypothetical protein
MAGLGSDATTFAVADQPDIAPMSQQGVVVPAGHSITTLENPNWHSDVCRMRLPINRYLLVSTRPKPGDGRRVAFVAVPGNRLPGRAGSTAWGIRSGLVPASRQLRRPQQCLYFRPELHQHG